MSYMGGVRRAAGREAAAIQDGAMHVGKRGRIATAISWPRNDRGALQSYCRGGVSPPAAVQWVSCGRMVSAPTASHGGVPRPPLTRGLSPKVTGGETTGCGVYRRDGRPVPYGFFEDCGVGPGVPDGPLSHVTGGSKPPPYAVHIGGRI